MPKIAAQTRHDAGGLAMEWTAVERRTRRRAVAPGRDISCQVKKCRASCCTQSFFLLHHQQEVPSFVVCLHWFIALDDEMLALPLFYCALSLCWRWRARCSPQQLLLSVPLCLAAFFFAQIPFVSPRRMASADAAPGLEDVEVVTKYKAAAEMANRTLIPCARLTP